MRTRISDVIDALYRQAYRCAFFMLRAWWFIVKTQTHGACVALWHEEKILLLRTSYRKGCTLPGGFIKRGESSEATARRELMEELGIDLSGKALAHAWNGTVKIDFHDDTVDIWEAKLDCRPEAYVANREIIWADWVSPADTGQLDLMPHIAAYLAKLKAI